MSALSPDQFYEHRHIEHHQPDAVGFLPTRVLTDMREWDRTQPGQAHEDSPARIEGIREDLRQGRGITHPVTVHYNPKQGRAYLGEGNHRLAAAAAEGVEEIPTVVTRTHADLDKGVPATHSPEAEYQPGRVKDMFNPNHLRLGY